MKPIRILICGLPGTGKTTMAKELGQALGVIAAVFDGDKVRAAARIWDFSPAGRQWQAETMNGLCAAAESRGQIGIASFICPTQQLRETFRWGNQRTFVIWLNRESAKAKQYPDTVKLFQPLGLHPRDPVHFKISHWQNQATEHQLVLKRLRKWGAIAGAEGPPAESSPAEGRENKINEGD